MANFVLRNGWSACLLVACLYLIVLAPSCGASQAQGAYAAEADPRKHAYVIGISDVLAINVWKDPELSTETVVRPDGTITMPLVGDLKAAGRTTGDLKIEIKQRLARYVQDPVVTVALSEVNSYRFTVSGQVAHPGVFSAKYYLTVSEAVALAGGPNRYASPEDVEVVRIGRGDRARRIPVDYDAIVKGERPDMDIVVLPGDTVYVP